MKLGLRAIATCLPAPAEQRSLLGAVVPRAYLHLYDPAGQCSRPPTVKRGVTTSYSPPYVVPAAATLERIADLASEAVRRLLLAQPGAAPRVRSILHAQCTLDQQILGSTCLRIEHDHFPAATNAAAIGQLGTAGLPTVLRLAALDLVAAAPAALACVSGADKWVAPFIRRVPGLVSYGDAAAACLVGRATDARHDIAHVLALHGSVRPPAHDLWTADAATQRAALLVHVHDTVATLLRRHGLDDGRDLWLAGDGYGGEFTQALAEALVWPAARVLAPDTPAHLSSAAGLFAIAQAVAAAAQQGRDIDAIVWTASPAGHAGALWLRCHAGARRDADGWSGADASPTSPSQRLLEHTP